MQEMIARQLLKEQCSFPPVDSSHSNVGGDIAIVSFVGSGGVASGAVEQGGGLDLMVAPLDLVHHRQTQANVLRQFCEGVAVEEAQAQIHDQAQRGKGGLNHEFIPSIGAICGGNDMQDGRKSIALEKAVDGRPL